MPVNIAYEYVCDRSKPAVVSISFGGVLASPAPWILVGTDPGL